MKWAATVLVLQTAFLSACGESTDLVVSEPDIRPSSGISIEGMSFFFPVRLQFEGSTETCGHGASDCPLADDSTILVWRVGQLRFDYVLDPFGETMPDKNWGEPITINGKPAFRKSLANGSRRYLITNHHGGADSAPVAIWREQEEPIFWGTCRSDEDCEAVLQTLASVSMRSAAQECALMFPKPPPEFIPPSGYCEDCSTIPQPPAPIPRGEQSATPAPPAPPVARPRGAEALCKDYRDES